MIRYDFGTLRFVELFDEGDNTEKQKFLSYLNVFIPGQISHGQIVGAVNNMMPLINYSQMIMVHDAVQKKLTPVAENMKQLQEIINELQEVWSGYNEQMFLPKNAQTLAAYEQFKMAWKGRNGMDLSFWLHFSFREFNIRFIV